MKKPIPVTVLTGYLGSGKTTLVNRLLADPQGMRIAVIVNDIGEINIDAKLIAGKGHASVADSSLVSLTNGCICCSLQTDLITQIVKLVKTDRFDYILIEASGVCEPVPIAQSIAMIGGKLKDKGVPTLCTLDSVVAVVDAYRLITEFSGGEALLDVEEEDIGRLLVEQIEFCNLVLLNKTDLLTGAEVEKVEAIVKALQPSAQILRTSFVDVPSQNILNTKLFDFEKTFLSAGWAQTVEEDEHEKHSHHHHADHHHETDHEEEHEEHSHLEEYGISTFVYDRRRPFDDSKLEVWVNHFPSGVIRCKGLVWISGEDDTSFLLEQAGKSVSVQPFAPWLAAASSEEREAAWQRDPVAKENWDEKIGDRMSKLVFIGADMNQQAIIESLDNCLDEELSF
ncbi:CobW family GTP-binding protein [Scatolibacter rhodanostii]|uniref:CobW family GTP-binding protein n=1 Tax=Scatolibacter rhodanostii TaxID=2014781 RepID=UPI000C06CE3C|nr:GTP-binding protein [Scatolibacter rhodanostii]